MRGWLVNDMLTTIPGMRSFWNVLIERIDGLEDCTTGDFKDLAKNVEAKASAHGAPDYIIRNANCFPPLDLDVPTISIVDAIGSHPWFYETCERSTKIVYNTEYTHSHYRDMDSIDHEIIPAPVDSDLFQPRERLEDLHGSVLFVGSTHEIKGYGLLKNIISASRREFVLVLRDQVETRIASNRCTILKRISQLDLSKIASSCSVGICTSIIETQHLAGIEAGLCGLPMVAPSVGVYADLESGPWGIKLLERTKISKWLEAIEHASELPRDQVRSFWISRDFDEETFIRRWRAAIDSTVRAHA